MGNKLLVISIVRPSLEERSKKATNPVFFVFRLKILSPCPFLTAGGNRYHQRWAYTGYI